MAQSIESLRKQIDAVDDDMIDLIFKRVELSNLIIKSKPPGQILDSAREQAILARYSQKLSGVSTPFKLKRLVSSILGTSRTYPEL